MRKQLLSLALLLFCSIAIFAQTPGITSFSPASGPVGTLVTITGSNLSSPTAFTIGGIAAIKVSGTATTLVGMVMPGATTGAVSLSTAGGSANSPNNFTIKTSTHPSIQQGSKLVGNDAVLNSYQGAAVAISADGNTAIVGGFNDSSSQGAVWIYIRSGHLMDTAGA